MHLNRLGPSRDAASQFNAHTEIEQQASGWDGELQTTNAHRMNRPKRPLHTTNRHGVGNSHLKLHASFRVLTGSGEVAAPSRWFGARRLEATVARGPDESIEALAPGYVSIIRCSGSRWNSTTLPLLQGAF